MNRHRRYAVPAVVLLTGLFALTTLAIAQEPATPATPAPAEASAPVQPQAPADAPAEPRGQIPTIYDLFRFNVPINASILALSVIAVVMFLFLLLALTAGAFAPRRLVADILKLIANRQFDQAIHLCQTNSGVFISSIAQRVLENRDKEHASLIEIVSTEGRRKSEPIWNRVNFLSEIANIAPLLGLLGTVMGMIRVFFTLTTRTAGEKASELAGGIGEAMGATMFGLLVAIAAGVFYTLIRSRAISVLAEAEQACHAVADETARAAVDPRLKKIDALADAARQKIAQATAGRAAGAVGPTPQPAPTTGFYRPPQP